MRKKLSILCVVGLLLGLSSCKTGKAKDEIEIYINGTVEETIEVNTSFVDKGVVYPDGYTLIKEGDVDDKHLGTYHIFYLVYSPDGELAKELHRYVNVVDTTSPVYTKKSPIDLYAGFTYEVSDFVEYSDNSNDIIDVTPSTVTFSRSGYNFVSFTLKDSSGNTTVFSQSVNVKFDLLKIIEEVYKNNPEKITKHESIHHIAVEISSEKSFSYYSDFESIHYYEKVRTSLGSSAEIQISAKYGGFDLASISFRIYGSGGYSVASANVDARISDGQIKYFELFKNDLNLDQNAVSDELNEILPTVLNNFAKYMNDVLSLDVI